MNVVKKIVVVGLSLAAALAFLITATQLYFALTPSELSAEAAALDAKVAGRPLVTESGLRLLGLLAPVELAPEQYGHCLFEAYERHRAEQKAARATDPMPSFEDKSASDAYWQRSSQRSAALQAPCAGGGVLLKPPASWPEPRIRPGISVAQWAAIVADKPHPALIERAEVILADGPRRLGVLPDSPITPFTPLLAIERWRTAEAWRQWQAGERSVALAAWDRSINDWVNSADDSLIDAMISMTVLSQIQLALQDAVARTDRIDDAAARAARATLARLDVLPEAVSQSLLAEWHMQASLMRSLRSLPAESLSVATGLSGPMAHVSSLWHALTFDVNDTLNALASEHAAMNAATVAAARGEAAPRIHSNAAANANGFGCAPLHTAAALCLPFMRNPVGRLLVTIATPMYAPYGLRVADVQNLAAATRLTVEARRQGLSGEALGQFVANAPADMRDLFSKQPFVYDASKRLLRVELRHKSNVLGDAGSYELTL